MENSETKKTKKTSNHFSLYGLLFATLGVGLSELINFAFGFNSNKYISIPILIGMLACASVITNYVEKKRATKQSI
jgi:NADH:ubiquinone oxidoreductase subunit 3 (subunit A)